MFPKCFQLYTINFFLNNQLLERFVILISIENQNSPNPRFDFINSNEPFA